MHHRRDEPQTQYFTVPPNEILLFDSSQTLSGDLGSGAHEFSGVINSLNSNRMLIVNDENTLNEFDLDDNFAPASQRTLSINIGNDIKGFAWVYGDTYTIVGRENTQASCTLLISPILRTRRP